MVTLNTTTFNVVPVNPYPTAIYCFTLNGNTNNTGTTLSQTVTTNSNTYEQVGGKTSNALLLTKNTNKFYLTTRFTLSNPRGSLSLFVYPIENENNTNAWFLYYNSFYELGTTSKRFGIFVQVDSNGDKTYYINCGPLYTTFTPHDNELAINQWTHIALTWSFQMAVGCTVNLYLNGIQRYTGMMTVTEWNSIRQSNTAYSNRILSTFEYTNIAPSSMGNVVQTYYTANLAY